ncbi:MAG: SDR family NAD(P)-dependent oxidoreductase [Alphaproteobacteria bacterium]|nr:MAG: SDR family NAD(P)-dependent oxidoreductase [Alphaproteobacteria bacterium]
MTISFEGKVAIVTGAGGGLGRSHALELARRGAKVVVNDLGGTLDGTGGSSDAAEAVVAEIKALGGDAISDGCSVTDEAGVANMVQRTMDTFGRIDVLINNAGILRDKSFAKMTMDDFRAVLDVHLMGTVICSKAVWAIMKEQQYGRIVVTTSVTGLYGNFGQTNYGAAKLGIIGFQHSLKEEGRKDNIRVNTIAPIAATRMTIPLMGEGSVDMYKPEQVTAAVMFLASEDAPTGAILSAGGGIVARPIMVETESKFIGRDLTAEDVAANFDAISDLSTALPLENGGAQGAKNGAAIQAGMADAE